MKQIIILILLFISVSASQDANESLFLHYKKSFHKLDRVIFDDFYDVCKDEDFSLTIALSFANSESWFNPLAVSSVGARGLMQIMPYNAENPEMLFNTKYNIGTGIKMLRYFFRQANYNLIKTCKYYNAGPRGKVFNENYVAEIVYYISIYEPEKTKWMFKI
jgi:hypothetical protein